MAAMGAAAQDEALGRLIEDVRRLGADTVIIHAYAALSSPGAPLGDVFFPTSLRPLRAQRQGASAFALCPDQPALPPAPALSAAFSAATYPYRP